MRGPHTVWVDIVGRADRNKHAPRHQNEPGCECATFTLPYRVPSQVDRKHPKGCKETYPFQMQGQQSVV